MLFEQNINYFLLFHCVLSLIVCFFAVPRREPNTVSRMSGSRTKDVPYGCFAVLPAPAIVGRGTKP